MTDLDQLHTLLERLEKADGPDRSIDRKCAEVAGYTLEVIKVPPDHPVFGPGSGLEFMVEEDGTRTGMPPYTASLDAAIALVEKVLPGWEWVRLIGGNVWVYLADEQQNPVESGMCLEPKTVPLGILTAMVNALIAKVQS